MVILGSLCGWLYKEEIMKNPEIGQLFIVLHED